MGRSCRRRGFCLSCAIGCCCLLVACYNYYMLIYTSSSSSSSSSSAAAILLFPQQQKQEFSDNQNGRLRQFETYVKETVLSSSKNDTPSRVSVDGWNRILQYVCYNASLQAHWTCHGGAAGKHPNSSPKIVVIHIFKTAGGTSLRELLWRYVQSCHVGYASVAGCAGLGEPVTTTTTTTTTTASAATAVSRTRGEWVLTCLCFARSSKSRFSIIFKKKKNKQVFT